MHPALLQFRAWVRAHPLYCLPGFQILVTTERLGRMGEGLVLLNLVIPPEARKHGYGRAVLAMLLEIADNHGLPVGLEASEQAASGSWNQGWYARRGFELTGERGNYGPLMVRPASIILTA
jgi:ribosomal protein S18 acetylase RimI-like enzyme